MHRDTFHLFYQQHIFSLRTKINKMWILFIEMTNRIVFHAVNLEPVDRVGNEYWSLSSACYNKLKFHQLFHTSTVWPKRTHTRDSYRIPVFQLTLIIFIRKFSHMLFHMANYCRFKIETRKLYLLVLFDTYFILFVISPNQSDCSWGEYWSPEKCSFHFEIYWLWYIIVVTLGALV